MIATSEILKKLTPKDFQALGVQQLAYIRPVMVNGAALFAIYAADGTQLALHDDEIAAKALSRQNELEPLTVQ